MIDTHRIYQDLAATLGNEAADKLAATLGAFYASLQQAVTKEDFRELKEQVAELAKAQARTESRLEELAQAQTRTESRLEELVQAQTRTESRLGELAGAQTASEATVKELTLNVSRLQDSVERLVEAHRRTNQHLGGLSHTVGYHLEDESYKALPALLMRDFEIDVRGRLSRKHVDVGSGEFVEINILGEATQQGKPVTIVGEAKTQLHRRDLLHFLADRVEPARNAFTDVFPVLVTYMTATHTLEDEVRKAGVALYYSYDLS